VGCGGSADVAINNQQEQTQAQDESDIQTAQDACAYCIEMRGADGTLAQCVTNFGFDISDC